ncbi:MAG: hypothetical protein NVV59_07125 [Chitinophagaceae bacterium]|nr:hypothetical protein [Chitinophagaceae bacterium]
MLAAVSCNNATDNKPNDITGRYHLPAKIEAGQGACISNELVLQKRINPHLSVMHPRLLKRLRD